MSDLNKGGLNVGKLGDGDKSSGNLGAAYGDAKAQEKPGGGKAVKPTDGDFSNGGKK